MRTPPVIGRDITLSSQNTEQGSQFARCYLLSLVMVDIVTFGDSLQMNELEVNIR